MATVRAAKRLSLPRSSATTDPPKPPVPGPSASAFTTAFGDLLPPAQWLETAVGKAAFYSLSPPSTAFTPALAHPTRVLLLHGVQTPALGLLPLTTALRDSLPHTHFVLLDLWGHGLSDTPSLPHTPALFHQLIDALLDHLLWNSAHFIGYSFGGATTVGYVATRPTRVDSFVLVAPAGLLRMTDFSPEEHRYLRGGEGVDEAEAHDWIINWLEDGGDSVPVDWKAMLSRGEVVPAAVRQWQKREHQGHVASVVSMLRDGGAIDGHESFLEAAKKGVRSLVVLGETDDVCSVRDLEDVGFGNVKVIPGAGHGVVRERVPDVALMIADFWAQLGADLNR